MTNRHGRINDDDGGFVADAKYGGVDNTDETGNNNDLYIAHRRTSKTPNNTIFFGGLLSAIGGLGRWARYAGGVKDRNGVEKVFGLLDPYGEYSPVGESGLLMVPTGVSWINVETSSGAIILQMNNDREINGYSMYLNIYFFQESIEIMKSTGTTTIPSSQIVEDGLYMLAYNSDGWRVSRIGDSCK
ncbi:hypothetical protein ACBZ91_06550 [Vibrio natriegens]|uniref:hypothetical protein n=1 Tax=Vibrio natriegens TaxID=691 RepID=UPI003557676F